MEGNNNPNKCINKFTLAENFQSIVNILCAKEFPEIHPEKKVAVQSLKNFLKSLPECYRILKESYNKPTTDSGSKKLIADVLSVISVLNLTGNHETEKREGLKYRFLGSDDFTIWGVGYLKNLVTQIVAEYEERFEKDNPKLCKQEIDEVAKKYRQDFIGLVKQIIGIYMRNGFVKEAIDLTLDFEQAIHLFTPQLLSADKTHYEQACLHITSKARVIHYSLLDVAYRLYCKFEDYICALRIAIFINKFKYVELLLRVCDDFIQMKQLCYLVARHGFHFNLDGDMMVYDDGERKELQDIINKLTWNQGYLALADDLDLMEPMLPGEVCKSRRCGSKKKLADVFVNAFMNAGFGKDLRMVGQENWVFKNESNGKMSETASLGLIMLWNYQDGFGELRRYMLNNDPFVKAGALLGIGILNSSVKPDLDLALELDLDLASKLLPDYVDKKNEPQSIRIGATMGLGLTYAYTGNKQVSERLIAIIESPDTSLELVAFAAISLGLVCMGFKDKIRENAADAIVKAIRIQNQSGQNTSTEKRLPFMRLICFAFGLLFLGEKESTSVPENLDKNMKKYCIISLKSCAYVGSGDRHAVQSLLGYCEEGTAVLGLPMVAIAEDVGFISVMDDLKYVFDHGEQNVIKAVPLVFALLWISNPERDDVIKILDDWSRDESNSEVAMSAIISLGLVGAGTNNDRIASILTELSTFHSEKNDELFCVQIAQGLLHLGKGLLTLNPYYSDGLLLSPVAFGGLVTFLHCCLDMKALMLGNYHFVLYYLVLAMQPRMLMTVDENLKIIHAPVQVSQLVDLTNIKYDETPVLLDPGDMVELCTDEYVPLSPILENLVILKHNPDYKEVEKE